MLRKLYYFCVHVPVVTVKMLFTEGPRPLAAKIWRFVQQVRRGQTVALADWTYLGRELKKYRRPVFSAREARILDSWITIGIASYNHSGYLARCIDSALSQDCKHFDIIIVDDCSTDPKNREILERYRHNKKVRIIYKTRNEGISESLNDQVINAKGNWIAFLDCDDYLPKDALSKAAKYIREHPEKRLVYSNRVEVDEEDNLVDKVWFGNRAANQDVFEELMKGMVSSHLKLIHKDVFRRVGLFDPRFGGTHDYDMYLRTAFYMPTAVGFIDDYLYYHRIHGRQNTKVESEKHDRNVRTMREEAHFRAKVYGGGYKGTVSFVILSFNRGHRLEKTVDSIFNNSMAVRKEIIIWDNNSSDDETMKVLRSLAEREGVRVVFSGRNLRCSGGRKEAAALAKGDFIFFLDNDIEVQEGTVEEILVRFNESADIAGVCCRVIFPDGRIQYNGGDFNREDGFITFDLVDSGKDEHDISSMRKLECAWIPGGATVFRGDVLEKVRHDPQYINAFEDNDFSFGVTGLGKTLVNCPTASVRHYHLNFENEAQYGMQKYISVRYDKDAFIGSWLHFYKKWGLIIKDDFIYKLAGLTGKSDREIEEYVLSRARHSA